MLKSTKTAVAGVFIGAAIVACGVSYQSFRDKKLAELVKQCSSRPNIEKTYRLVPDSGAIEKNPFDKFDDAPWTKFAKAVQSPRCDPFQIYDEKVYDPPELEKIKTLRGEPKFDDLSYMAAAAVIVFCSMPYAWQFLLRRIVELRLAITGK